MATHNDPKNMKFEQALKTLESITEKMNSGTVDLDEMLKLYEEGIQFLKICRQKLAEAELKVQILNEKMKQELPEEEENGQSRSVQTRP